MDVLRAIRNDRTSGAQKLSLKSLKAFIELVEKAKTDDAETQRELIFSIAQRIASAQPSMASVFNCMNNLFPLKGRNAEEIQRYAIRKAKREIEIIIDFDKRISENGARLLWKGDTILTLSSSSSVLSILRKVSNKNINVIVCESYPMGEGRQFAKSILKFVKTTLIPDFSFPYFMKDVNVVLLGTDAVCPTHIINKCGTSLIVKEARRRNIPTICACDTNKAIPFNLPIKEFSRKLRTMAKKEILFDRTPLRFITYFVTEKGILDSDAMRSLVEEKKRRIVLSI